MDANTIDLIKTIGIVVSALCGIVVTIFSVRFEKAKIDIKTRTDEILKHQKSVLRDFEEFGQKIITYGIASVPRALGSSDVQRQLQQSALEPFPAQSHFDQRKLQYIPEKTLLAEKLVDSIVAQIKADSTLTIALVIDGGTTLYQLFQMLCSHEDLRFNAVNASRLKIITNSLPGILVLNKLGRTAKNSTLFECRVLAGEAHFGFETSIGRETPIDLERAISSIKTQEPARKTKVIGALSAHFVSLSEGILQEHTDLIALKSKMLDVCDEIYCAVPFSKLTTFSSDKLNKILGNFSHEECLNFLQNWAICANKINLLVTSRPPNYFGNIQPNQLGNYFAHTDGSLPDGAINLKSLVRLEFDPLDDFSVRTNIAVLGERRALCEYEIPDRRIRSALLDHLQKVGKM